MLLVPNPSPEGIPTLLDEVLCAAVVSRRCIATTVPSAASSIPVGMTALVLLAKFLIGTFDYNDQPSIPRIRIT